MKKGNTLKKSVKLSLSRETLRHLEPAGLRVVAGGISFTYCSETCYSACSFCDN